MKIYSSVCERVHSNTGPMSVENVGNPLSEDFPLTEYEWVLTIERDL
jgi:hypothetical protein